MYAFGIEYRREANRSDSRGEETIFVIFKAKKSTRYDSLIDYQHDRELQSCHFARYSSHNVQLVKSNNKYIYYM